MGSPVRRRPRVELVEDRTGGWGFRLIAQNGKRLDWRYGYTRHYNAVVGARRALKRWEKRRRG